MSVGSPRTARRYVTLALALAISFATLAMDTDAQAEGVDVEIIVGGGSVFAWDALDEAGNGFAFGAAIGVDNFTVGFSGAAVLPDGRTQGQMGAFWAEGRWFPLGRGVNLAPYVLAGLGLATPDDFDPQRSDIPDNFNVPRWVTESVSFLAVIGGGVRFGDPDGLWVGVDIRGYNHTHAGVALTAGFVL